MINGIIIKELIQQEEITLVNTTHQILKCPNTQNKH